MGQNYHCYHKVFPPSVPLLTLLVVSIALHSMSKGQSVNELVSDHFFLSGNHYLNISEYYFVMQIDCDLVLYEGAKAVLSSNTCGLGYECSFRMQGDGDMVVYTGTHSVPIWESKATSILENYSSLLTRNGSLLIYDFEDVAPIASLREILTPVANAQASDNLANLSYPYSPHPIP